MGVLYLLYFSTTPQTHNSGGPGELAAACTVSAGQTPCTVGAGEPARPQPEPIFFDAALRENQLLSADTIPIMVPSCEPGPACPREVAGRRRGALARCPLRRPAWSRRAGVSVAVPVRGTFRSILRCRWGARPAIPSHTRRSRPVTHPLRACGVSQSVV